MSEQFRTTTDDTTPMAGFYEPTPPPEEPKRRKGLAAAVLAGSLVLGAAAGFGGAALYDAQESPTTSSSGATAGPITASDESVEAGSVEQVAAKVLPSVVKINVQGNGSAGSGSGVVLDDQGHILTNNHVVAVSGGQISVSFNDGRTLRAEVVGRDPVTDIAVIKVDGADDLTPAEVGSSGQLKVGQSVVAVGSPYGLNATVTTGIVSALNRAVSVASEEPAPQPQGPFGPQQDPSQDLSTTYPAIQTDAAINPGNSGGPLVDMAGRVVGINSSIRTAGGSVGGNIGLGFAIPIDQVLPIVNQLVAGEDPTHARMAVSVSDVPGDTLARGALIRSVEAGGPAAGAGLREGDVVTKVDDLPIDDSESLVATIRGHRPGDEVEITYLRGDDEKTVTVELGSDAESDAS